MRAILDGFVKSQKTSFFVIPSRIGVRDDGQAGIQSFQIVTTDLDPGFRRGDDFLRVHHSLLLCILCLPVRCTQTGLFAAI